LIREYEPVDDVDRYTLYPVTELDVLAFHDRPTVCWIAAPEPEAVSVVEPALEVKSEMFADAEPATVGVNVTVKGRLWPDARVAGKVRPPTVNAELLELAEDRTTLPPLAVTLPL